MDGAIGDTIILNGAISPMIELGAGFDQELTARENIYLNGAVLGYSKKFINEKFDEIVAEHSEKINKCDKQRKKCKCGCGIRWK